MYTSRTLRPAANWFFHLCSAYDKFLYRALCVVRFAHGIVVDAQFLGRGAELLLDLGQQPLQAAVAGQDEGAVVVDDGSGGAPRYKHVVVRRGVRHVPVVLNLQKKQDVYLCSISGEFLTDEPVKNR